MGTALGGVGLEQPVVANCLACRPGKGSSTTAKALSRHHRSRRSGAFTRIEPVPVPKRRSLGPRRPDSISQRLPWYRVRSVAVSSVLLTAGHQACFMSLSRCPCPDVLVPMSWSRRHTTVPTS